MSTLERINRYVAQHAPATPCVVIDLETVREHDTDLRRLLPDARIDYEMKPNPAVPVVSALDALDTCFDVASAGEIDHCRALAVDATRFRFGNTVKRERDIAWAHALGIDL
jgi:ornithine decarboxylase